MQTGIGIMIQPLLRKAAAATLIATLAATTLIAVFSSSPASTQNPLPLLSATGCTDGTYVDTSTYPTVAGANNDLVDDCQALVSIQKHWAANNLGSNHPLRSWGTTTQKIGTWAGITVSSSRVSTLNLTSSNLTGSIPTEIGSLANLTSLYLDDNRLRGSIPAELGNLTNLAVLNLSFNNLTGSIPAELGNLANLASLYLSHNDLTGSIPAELGRLTPSQGGKIRVFTICPNKFTGTVPTALRSLFLIDCVSSPTPPPPPLPSFITIPVLSSTNCSNGTFVDTTAYPVVPGTNNDLVDDCKALVAMQNHWAINANAIGNREQLSSDHPLRESKHPLRVWGTTAQKINTWKGITVTSGRVSSLNVRDASDSQFFAFYGSIPAAIGNLTNLTQLHLGNSELVGRIPAEIGNLTKLTLLYLSDNDFAGSIPAELGNLKNLTSLYLAHNSLTGSIPAELGNLINLSSLLLDNNRLTGSIPAELGNLANLAVLNLSYNDLTGNIPAELGNLANLTSLYLAHNDLTGSIPAELDRLTPSQGGKIRVFTICRQRFAPSDSLELQFTGPVPPALRSVFSFYCVSSSTTTSSTTTTSTTTTTTTTSTVPGGGGGDSSLWNTLTIERTGTTLSQIRQTLGLASNQAIYAWDTQTQTWQRLTDASRPIPADTMLTFRTEQAISREDLEELNLARGTRRTTLAAGWNIISIPEAITSGSTGFLLADELTDCDADTAILAIANYSAQTRAWRIWLPCNSAAQTRLTTGTNPQYRPLTAIAPSDTTYIYSRSAQTIAWNSDTRTYQTSTS